MTITLPNKPDTIKDIPVPRENPYIVYPGTPKRIITVTPEPKRENK